MENVCVHDLCRRFLECRPFKINVLRINIFFSPRNEWSHTLKGPKWSKEWEAVQLKMATVWEEISFCVSLLHCSMGLKEEMTSDLFFDLCAWELARGVRTRRTCYWKQVHGMRKIYKFLNLQHWCPFPSHTLTWTFMQLLCVVPEPSIMFKLFNLSN